MTEGDGGLWGLPVWEGRVVVRLLLRRWAMRGRIRDIVLSSHEPRRRHDARRRLETVGRYTYVERRSYTSVCIIVGMGSFLLMRGA